MVKPDWHEGAPPELMVGMLIRAPRFGVLLVGDITENGNMCGHADAPVDIEAWALAIKPHELEWLGGKEAR